MGTTTNHSLEYPDDGDQIASYPTTAKASADRVDEALPVRGGTAGQVLAKSDNADYKYFWKDITEDGGGEPFPGISNKVPNDLQEVGDPDPGLYVPPTWLNSEDADDVAYAAAATVPVQLFGPGRPDAAGLNLTAPEGSTFTCTDSNGGNNFGARKWSKGPSGWVCTDGYVVFKSDKATASGNGYCYLVLTPEGTMVAFNTVPGGTLSGGGSLLFDGVPSWFRVEGSRSFAALLDNASVTQTFVALTPGNITLYSHSSEPNWSATRRTGNAYASGKPNHWPSSTNDNGWTLLRSTPARTLEELKALVEEIQAEGETHELWPQYEALKQELEQLHNSTGTGDIQ